MSITIYVQDAPTTQTMEPCLCAQMFEFFGEAMDNPQAFVDELQEEADPWCRQCNGKGQEPGPAVSEGEMNLASASAGIFFRLLGLDLEEYQCTLVQARRALMSASAASLGDYTLPGMVEHGAPTERDGVTVLRPIRMISMEVGEDRLQRYMEGWSKLVEVAIRCKATHIVWG